MFYCDTCAEQRKWPESFSRSYGRCEICERTAACNDTPSRHLPMPPRRVASTVDAPTTTKEGPR